MYPSIHPSTPITHRVSAVDQIGSIDKSRAGIKTNPINANTNNTKPLSISNHSQPKTNQQTTNPLDRYQTNNLQTQLINTPNPNPLPKLSPALIHQSQFIKPFFTTRRTATDIPFLVPSSSSVARGRRRMVPKTAGTT